MSKKFFSIFLGFLGVIAQTLSGLSMSRMDENHTEVDRIWQNFIRDKTSNEAVLLFPRSSILNQKFLFLTAHGSHSSHASHASHVSHSSGTSHKSGSSCQVYTPISPPLTSSDIIGFKDTKFANQKGIPLVLYLPNSTLNHPSIDYQVLNSPMFGMVKILQDGRIIYTPDSGYRGLDSFSIYATDGNTQTEPVLFTVNMQ